MLATEATSEHIYLSTILHTYIAYLLCTVIYMPHFLLQIYDTGVFIVLRHCANRPVQVDKSEAETRQAETDAVYSAAARPNKSENVSHRWRTLGTYPVSTS